jgi:Dolichyl-phosphate-mannose-protein mannosyltransferase
MTRASDTQDQTEARGPGIRGWFQPVGHRAADADADRSGEVRTADLPEANGNGIWSGLEGPSALPDETTVLPRIPADDADLEDREAGDSVADRAAPDETTVFPRVAIDADPQPGEPEVEIDGPTTPVALPAAARSVASAGPRDDELPTTEQTPLIWPAIPAADRQPDANRQPDAEASALEDAAPEASAPDETTVFPQVPFADAPDKETPETPKADRPPDITRPQLILDDTMVDMAAVRSAADRAPADRTAPAGEDAADGDAAPSGKKRNRSVFGPEPAARPDMLTNAETVVMASVKDTKEAMPGASPKDSAATASTRNVGAVREQAITEMVPAGTSAAFAEAATQVMSTVKPSGRKERPRKPRVKRDRPPAPPRRYTPGRRTTMISRLVLLAILILQAVLSLRLRNTAFEDESLYLYSGRMELEHLLHGAPLYGGFASYFSGAPVLYPVLAAALNMAGGLALARALSLFEMLAVTALLYTLTRRLFNERIALCAAGFFSVSEAVIFLGNFATFDATCLFLLAGAAWIVVRTAAFRWPVFLLAAPVAALAVAVKYAGLLFVPTIAVLPALAGWPERGRRVLLYPLAFGVAVAGILYAALRLGGPAYLSAIKSTTTNRAHGAVPVVTLLREAAEWGGVLFAVAVIGTIAYVWRVRTEPEEKIAPAGGRVRRTALGVVLTGTALLAPAYQAHLHTDISFLKHIGFGLFFAAPMAGFGLARVMGDYFRRPQIGIGVWSLALVLGMVQSSSLYHVWPSSSQFVQTFARYLKPNALYLVEVPEVPMYYLQGRTDAQPRQFTSTFPVPPLTTNADFANVVKTGEFQVIAYTGLVTPGSDQALGKALAASRSYYLAATVSASDSSGPVTYYIWVKGHKPGSGSPSTPKAKRKAAGT